ncbi:MAG: hypothetical protein V1789_05215 [PVC group bacterium]
MKKLTLLAWMPVMALLVPGVPAAGAEETVLPVTKVTAFISGVAYYEHNGTVRGNEDVLLEFKTGQINDILKSLVLIDRDGGKIDGVNYASQEPLARALKNFGVDISGDPTLGQLLRQLRGADVVVEAPDTIAGKILGIETRKEQVLPANVIIEREILNILTPGGVKSIALDTISSLRLGDEKLGSELNKALALLAENRDTSRKPVQLSFRGEGERRVRVGYINEAPVWKTSYRLVLGDADAGTALMQGWAIVENTSDFDWENVELTFVSGRPISFIQDLYTPLYLPRPVVEPELYSSLRPPVHAEGMTLPLEELNLPAAPGRGRGDMRMMQKAMAPSPGSMVYDRAEFEEAADLRDQLAAVQPAAEGAAVGELFSYRIGSPVTLPRSKSAMLPIINQDVEARRVSIYNRGVLAGNPLNGVWLTNDTDLSLLAGPVTVFDAGTYAGDAQIGSLSPGDKRLLSYAIDLKVTVDSSQKSSDRIVTVKIVRGVMEVGRRYRYQQEYILKNKAETERAVIIEHPRRRDGKLIQPDKPLEQTGDLYRFEVEVPPAETGTFEVIEEKDAAQTIAILPCAAGDLLWYARNGEVPQKARDALAKVVEMKNALSQAERDLDDLEAEVKSLRGEQEHVRKNMGSVTRGSQAYSRFEKKLLDLETEIEALQEKIATQNGLVERLRKELADHINNLNIN